MSEVKSETKTKVMKLSEEMKEKLAEALPILGHTWKATHEGFKEYIVFSNVMDANGYELLSLVRLDSTIAATYRKRAATKKVRYAAAFDEDEGDDGEDGTGSLLDVG